MKLRQINEDNKEFFTYVEMQKDMWREKIQAAQDEFKIHFDLENDEEVTQRTIVIDQKQWDHTKCKFNCALFCAGGDWESPAFYFRCQLIDGYAKGLSTSGTKSHFIFIPNKEQGNFDLEKTSKGWTASEGGRKSDSKKDEKKVWEALKEYLKGLVDAEIATVQKN